MELWLWELLGWLIGSMFAVVVGVVAGLLINRDRRR